MPLPPNGTAILDHLRCHAAATPERPAILAPGRPQLGYGALWTHIDRVSGALRHAGVDRTSVVAAALPDGPELITACLAVARLAAFAPLNPGLRGAEVEQHLSNLRPRILIVPSESDAPVIDVARRLGVPVHRLQSRVSNAAGVFALSGVEATSLADVGQPDGAYPLLLLHTSATTGRAKLVCLSRSNLDRQAANSIVALQLGASDCFLSMMPLFHLQGLLSALEQLMVGGSVVSAPAFDAEAFPSWLEEFRPTWYTAGPALHRAILSLVRQRPEIAARAPLRFVRSIGAALPSGLLAELEEALGVPVLEGYGLTEAGAVTSNPLPPRTRKPGSAGIGIGPELVIADESGRALPAGAMGEILVRGPSVMQGYRDDTEANLAAFRSGWLRTGDLGYLDGDGYLFVTGRLKEMINRGGEKVLPGEIDQALAAHPAVAEAAAFGIPHPSLGEDVAAAVVLRAGAQATVSELRHFAATRLTASKVPRRIAVLDAIPKGATGKPQRGVLSEQAHAAWRARGDRAANVASTPLEQALARIWESVLESGPVGAQEDFFALGGDSFSATLMLAQVQQEFGELPDPSEFFLDPTIATLARVLGERTCSHGAEASGQHGPFILALQPNGSRPPLFCIPGAGEDPYYFRHLARRLGQERPFYVLRDPRRVEQRGAYTVEEVAERFASAVRSTRPHGPYFLGGHCYGGLVAFELARRLEAAGEPVGLLALFDSPTPGYPKVLRHWRRYLQRALSFAFDRRITFRDVGSHARFLWRSSVRRASPRPVAPAATTGTQVPPGSVQAAPSVANETAGQKYFPMPFAGKVHVFLAGDEHHSTRILDDSRLGWRDFARGGFEHRTVPGKHDSMFSEPHVRELAGQLRELLDAAGAMPAAAKTRSAAGGNYAME